MSNPNPTPGIAYSYLRFSSPEQARGDSIRRQTAMRDEWCQKNGIRLDTSLNMADEGISAFVGDNHRENPDRHALAGFLELIRQNKVARGSFLIIENLDRLTREDAVPALHLFTGILQAGVRIVQLDPESTYTAKSEYMDIMRALLELSRGNSESRSKSRRMGAVWGEKRKQAATSGAVLSRACPAWIKVKGEGPQAQYELIPARAEVIRRIFQLTIDGYGVRAIVNILTREKVPLFAHKPWNTSYLKVILKNRSTFGEFTPRTGRGSSQKRKPSGPPIADYYPAAITSDEFYAAQEATKVRRLKGGRPGKRIVNVFGAMLFDARTRTRLHVKQYSRGNGQMAAYLTPYSSEGESVSFQLDIFERAVFKELREIDPKDVLPAGDSPPDVLLTLAGRRSDVDAQLLKIKASIKGGAELDTLIDLVRELETERKRLDTQLEEARQKDACPIAESWAEMGSVLDALESAPDRDAARTKLRSSLRKNVSEVWCLFMPGRGTRVAAVQFFFTGGARRDYVILQPQSSKPLVRSLASVAQADDLDLRRPEDAQALEEALAGFDLTSEGVAG